MTPAPPPSKTFPPGAAAERAAEQAVAFSIGSTKRAAGEIIVIYGPGGIGKTSLAALAPSPLFIDAENGARHIDAKCVQGVTDWASLIAALKCSTLWTDCKTIVLDGGGRIQQWATEWTLENVPHEKGCKVKSVEDYGYGKGYQFVLDTFMALPGILDYHAIQGRNVVLVCHDTTTMAPNPEGEDYLRYEPDLQQPPKTGRIRDMVKNWCDHLLRIGYDVSVDDKGKAKGVGTRCIYCQERPTFWAKSRVLSNPIPYEKGSNELWKQLLGAK